MLFSDMDICHVTKKTSVCTVEEHWGDNDGRLPTYSSIEVVFLQITFVN